jgi:hypothetical protein
MLTKKFMATIKEEIDYLNLADIVSYREMVNNAADQNSTQILPNAGPIHAAIAMSKLLDKTIHKAKLIVGRFSEIVCDQPNYLNSLKEAIDRNVSFEVIFFKGPNDSEAYKLLKNSENAGKSVLIKKASEKFVKFLSRENKVTHFATFDDDKFRFENDAEHYVAYFSFNNRFENEFLSQLFDTEFQS